MDRRLSSFFKVFSEISGAVQDGEHLDGVLGLMLERIAEVLGAKGCTLRILEPGAASLWIEEARGLSRSYLEKGPVAADPGRSEIFDPGPVVIRDVAHDPRVQYPEAALREGIVSIVGLPVALVGGMRMLLRIYFDRPIDLSDDEIRFLDAIVGQGAAAIRCALMQSRYFDTFRSVISAIHGGEDIQAILSAIVSRIASLMMTRGAIFWVVDQAEGRIVHQVGSGFSYASLAGVGYRDLTTIFPLDNREPICIDDARYDERLPNLERLGKKRVRTVIGLPVAIVPPYAGILAVYFGQQRHLTVGEANFLQALAEQGAVALHKALRYDEKMLVAFRQTVEVLVMALEAKDPFTHGHSLKVAQYARRTALALGLSDLEAETVYQAGLLHDIGKIGMQDRILSRLGRLSSREMDIIRLHPEVGASILAPLTSLKALVPLVRHHHERYDGKGYPDGLTGEAIPLGARILAACDAFDCMLSGRPHIAAVPLARALVQLEAGAGVQFDPRVAAALAEWVRKDPEAVSPLDPTGDYLDRFRTERIRAKPFPDRVGLYPALF
ncbi:MAG: HD domain-containing protein [Desulfobacterales bacterium]|jgi:putative nucleotidyltransferase with HDIG domain|nr:HD domain-containing protein [Desulfobacteraceae bacterium]MDY0312898.1 HD domain-containing protein [Desulfobacterales bacterium]